MVSDGWINRLAKLAAVTTVAGTPHLADTQTRSKETETPPAISERQEYSQGLEGAERWLEALKDLSEARKDAGRLREAVEKLLQLNKTLRERLGENIPEQERKSIIEALEAECERGKNSDLLKNAEEIVGLLQKERQGGSLSQQDREQLRKLFSHKTQIVEKSCKYQGS